MLLLVIREAANFLEYSDDGMVRQCHNSDLVSLCSEQASKIMVATEAMACPFLGLALVPSNLNNYYGILNHVLALVPFEEIDYS